MYPTAESLSNVELLYGILHIHVCMCVYVCL